MKFSDLLISRASGDLGVAIEALAEYWNSIPVPNRPKGDLGQLASDVLSYRRKLEDLPEEYKSTLWMGVSYLLEKLADADARKIVDDSKIVRNESALTPGRYWVVGGEFNRCNGEFIDFVLENQELFTGKLGIDGWRIMRSRHSRVDDIVRLMLVSGAAIAVIGHRDGAKYARYQCCQKALPDLKRMSSSMAIKTSFFRIYDPSKPYEGLKSGILFVVRH